MQNHMINSDIVVTLPTIRVAVIDGHPLFRAGTIQALTTADGIEVAGEGATAADARR